MHYDKENTLIVVISIIEMAELPYLKRCCSANTCNDTKEPVECLKWTFAYSNGDVWKCKNGDEGIDNGDDFSFLLINQCKSNDNAFCNKVKQIINGNTRQHIIVWTHRGTRSGSLPILEKNEMIVDLSKKSLLCFKPFSHGGGSPFEEALKKLPTDFSLAFDEIISLSLQRKSHLIALSILCQGYLTMQEGIELRRLSDDVINMVKNNWSKAKNDWWVPAFGAETAFENTGVYAELKDMNKEGSAGAIKDLFVVVQGLKGKDFPDTGKVTAANKYIKGILKGK